MNERIQELAKQAKLNNSHYIAGQGFLVNDIGMEKFAELMIQECAKVIVNGGYRNPALGEKHSLTPPEIATMIQEHFGVEL
jgi:predicted polyphosphate/ATP-dependent NAD kinase